MRCKANCAACVRVKMPHPTAGTSACKVDCLAQMARMSTKYLLDKGSLCGVFILTSAMTQLLGDRGALKGRQQALLQGRCPLGRGHVECRTRKGQRSEIPGKRVLRSARHRAGQVRDVAPSVRRQCAGDGRRRGVWSLQADVLSDQSKLR